MEDKHKKIAYKILDRYQNKLRLKNWRIFIDNKYVKRCTGEIVYPHHDDKVAFIKLSKKLFDKDKEYLLYLTIVHELCHVLTKYYTEDNERFIRKMTLHLKRCKLPAVKVLYKYIIEEIEKKEEILINKLAYLFLDKEDRLKRR